MQIIGRFTNYAKHDIFTAYYDTTMFKCITYIYMYLSNLSKHIIISVEFTLIFLLINVWKRINTNYWIGGYLAKIIQKVVYFVKIHCNLLVTILYTPNALYVANNNDENGRKQLYLVKLEVHVGVFTFLLWMLSFNPPIPLLDYLKKIYIYIKHVNPPSFILSERLIQDIDFHFIEPLLIYKIIQLW